MKCPKCQTELSIYILRPDHENFCEKCEYVPERTNEWLLNNVEARYCPKVQNGDCSETEFEEYGCDDCIYDECCLATTVLDDFGMIQDEEGNWCYPEDMDDSEKENLE